MVLKTFFEAVFLFLLCIDMLVQYPWGLDLILIVYIFLDNRVFSLYRGLLNIHLDNVCHLFLTLPPKQPRMDATHFFYRNENDICLGHYIFEI